MTVHDCLDVFLCESHLLMLHEDRRSEMWGDLHRCGVFFIATLSEKNC